jgi:hypothetical protein
VIEQGGEEMNYKKVVLLIGAFIVFIFASLVSWYEGGQLRDTSWEWKYSAVFSNWLYGEVTSPNEILVIDHFVYAAKFEPFFPLLMAFSLSIILFQLVFWLTNRHQKLRNSLFLGIAILSFALSILTFNSPTTGLLLFSLFFGIMGILSLLIVFLYKDEKKQKGNSKIRKNLQRY